MTRTHIRCATCGHIEGDHNHTRSLINPRATSCWRDGCPCEQYVPGEAVCVRCGTVVARGEVTPGWEARCVGCLEREAA
jgi:hypothetical protein